jgi:predicted dehydrogenase
MASPQPLHLAFLGCGFITGVHSRHLQSLRSEVTCSYASRDQAKAEAFRRRFDGRGHFSSYETAINDPGVDAVVIAVPPKFHLELALQALAAGKHVLVEKPAFLTTADYRTAMAARTRANRVVVVGENDHYKPLAVRLRAMLRDGVIGDLVFAHFVTVARRLKTADDWRNDELMAGGDAFFEEGIHWLHFAGSLGPRIVRIEGFRPAGSSQAGDRRLKSMMVAFQYDTGGVGSLYYSREIPSLLLGIRVSKLFGRLGVITFESNGVFVWARGKGLPRFIIPGVADIRGYRAMYRDFIRAMRTGTAPEMSLERALDDHLLMETVYASVDRPVPAAAAR